ncbi:MAG: DUF4339 domain-containing protein [Oligoflexia bacterium]|nr:DUF4339 domain-containing protein [Oligoflexia bacterium]
MNQDFEPIWHVEAEGRKSGPYTLDKIQELFVAGKLRPKDRVTAPHLGNRWITVQEASEAYLRRTATGTISLPPRPTEAPAAVQPKQPGADPVLGLFDVIQHAKSRQAISRPSLDSIKGATVGRKSRIPGQAWLILSVTAVLAVSIGIVYRLIRKSAQQLEQKPAALAGSTAESAPAAKTAPTPATVSRPLSQPVNKFQSQPAVPKFQPRGGLGIAPPAPAQPSRDERDLRDARDARDTRDERDRERERDSHEDWRARDERGDLAPPTDSTPSGVPAPVSAQDPAAAGAVGGDPRQPTEELRETEAPQHNPTGQ